MATYYDASGRRRPVLASSQVGILRLHDGFASRSSPFSHDDNLSEGNRCAVDDFLDDLLGLFGFFQCRSIKAVDDHAVSEDGHDERLAVFRGAEIAAIEK